MDSKKSQELNHTSEQLKCVAPTTEAPPSYSEAVMGNTEQQQQQQHPTAPALEKPESTNPSANNSFPSNQYAPQGPPPAYTANDPRFAQWDDRATRILITNRLKMNDQFSRAKSRQEEELLWNLILIQLINDGYPNLVLYNLIEYWTFQFYIYQSILNGLSSNLSHDWRYFEPMHSVFGGSGGGGSGFAGDALMASNTGYLASNSFQPGPGYIPVGSSTLLPTPIITPTPMIHNTPIVASSNEALPNQDATTATSSSVDAPPLPSSNAIPTTADAAASESVPLLEQQQSTGTNGLLSTTSNDVNLPAELATASLGDAAPSTDTAATNLLSGSNNVVSDAITSQPSESLVPTLLTSDDVITSQPTFAVASPPLTTSDAANDGHGCCGGGGGDDGYCGADDGCCGDDDCCGDVDYCCVGCEDACGDCGDCDLG